jgi:hypothetical protein
MSVRVTSAEVEEIIEIDSTIITDLTPFITVANRIVEDNLTSSVLAIADETLKEIERWLAAHAAAHMDQRVASETAGPVSASYQHKLGLDLRNTMYGQMAIILDPTGTLAALADGKGGLVRVQSIDAIDGGT